MKKPMKITLLFIISVVLVTVLAVNLYINKVLNKMVEPGGEGVIVPEQQNPDGQNPDEGSASSRTNILMIGIDDARADTIMLLSIDKKSEKIDLISVPRDTYYYRSGYERTDQKKINASYGIKGELPEKSRSVAQAVSNVLGVKIDHYVRFDFESVVNIVDGVGGVKYDVPMEIPSLKIAKGPQVLDGKSVLGYLRYRKGYNEGDIGRVKAQQEFVKAMIKEGASLNNALDFIDVISANIKTSMGVSEMKSLSKSATKFINLKTNNYVIPGKAQTIDGLSFYVHDAEGTKAMIKEIFK